MATAAWPRSTNMMATMNSGASEAMGASHCTSRNSLMPKTLPEATRFSLNSSALARMTPAANRNSARVARRRRFRGSAPKAGSQTNHR